MSPENFIQLLQKYREGIATEVEKKQLLQSLPEQGELLSGQINADFYDSQLPDTGDDHTRDIIYRSLELRLLAGSRANVGSGVQRVFIRYAAAAAVLIAVATGVFLWRSDSTAVSRARPVISDIAPGHNGAILTLANGSQVLLDTIKNGVVALQGGAVATIVNGALRYEGNGTAAVYNTITTPKGRLFEVTLPDGSHVWLNAASQLRFPTAFTGNHREVEVRGEAYFDIVPDKDKPFFARVADIGMIEVLGTGFNINTHKTTTAITLINGSVRVKNTADTQAPMQRNGVVLTPGQQALMAGGANTADTDILVRSADTEKVLAWKNGLFQFDNASLTEVMDELKLWYNIEVVYEKNIPDIYFGGKMSRDLSLSGLLRGLNASEVHFRIEEEGRRLVITP